MSETPTPSEETATIPIRLTFYVTADEEVRPTVEHGGFLYDLISTAHGFKHGSTFVHYAPRGMIAAPKPKHRGKRGGRRRRRGGRGR